jgi:hypothetical protein
MSSNQHHQQQPLNELFMIVPADTIIQMNATMATFSRSIIEIPLSMKWDLHLNCLRSKENVFLTTLGIKILQSVATD